MSINNMKITLVCILIFGISSLYARENHKISLNKNWKECAVKASENILEVSTGTIKVKWGISEKGMYLTELSEMQYRKQWISETSKKTNWNIPGVTEGDAIVKNITAKVDDDEGFTNKHLAVTVHFDYPATGSEVKMLVWLYNKSTGIRTQLLVKGPSGKPQEDVGILQRLPISPKGFESKLISYTKHNPGRMDTINQVMKPFMMEDIITAPYDKPRVFDKRLLLQLNDKEGSLVVVKEAPVIRNLWWDHSVCYHSGAFILSKEEISITGVGIAKSDLKKEKFQPAYATWFVLGGPGDAELQYALKSFDRQRFPMVVERDLLTFANNWGSTDNTRDGKISSMEPSILEEIDACAETGIEAQQIDDGWQINKDWSIDPKAYPEGWENLKKLAKEKGVKLGIWCDGDDVNMDKLMSHVNNAGFIACKFDFYKTYTYEQVQDMMARARRLVKESKQPLIVNWDVTGGHPKDRGYFYGREYGNLWYRNVKQHNAGESHHTLYQPYNVLEDVWLLSKYVNAYDLQIGIQNTGRVFEEPSDAHLHSQSYAVAIALVGSMNFFYEVKYLSAEDRQEIKSILEPYKKVREDMHRGIVYPIGHKPNNRSWTGFQVHNHKEDRGYLTVFREIHNNKPSTKIALKFLKPGAKLHLTNLLTNKTWQITLNDKSIAEFQIENPADFLFLKYNQF